MGRLSRRARFAAPFVVIACSGPKAQHPAPPDDDDTDGDRVAVAADAAVDPPDAPADAPDAVAAITVDAGVIARVARGPVGNDYALCGDTRVPRGPNMPTCNPPGPYLRGTIVKREVTGDGLHITISRGAKDGVKTGWKAELLDDRNKPIPNFTFTIARVSERSCVGVLVRHSDLPSHQVRIGPP